MSDSNGNNSSRTLGLILTGGESRRMGGREKGLLEYRGRPMLDYAYQALAPHCDSIVISCNREIDRYREFIDAKRSCSSQPDAMPALSLLQDNCGAIRGPTAGIVSFMRWLDCNHKHDHDLELSPSTLANSTTLILSCDMPGVDAKLTAALLKGFASRRQQQAATTAANIAHFSRHIGQAQLSIATGDAKNSGEPNDIGYSSAEQLATDARRKDYYLPQALDTASAIALAKNWLDRPEAKPTQAGTGKHPFSLRQWIAELAENKTACLALPDELQASQFISINTSETLATLNRH